MHYYIHAHTSLVVARSRTRRTTSRAPALIYHGANGRRVATTRRRTAQQTTIAISGARGPARGCCDRRQPAAALVAEWLPAHARRVDRLTRVGHRRRARGRHGARARGERAAAARHQERGGGDAAGGRRHDAPRAQAGGGHAQDADGASTHRGEGTVSGISNRGGRAARGSGCVGRDGRFRRP